MYDDIVADYAEVHQEGDDRDLSAFIETILSDHHPFLVHLLGYFAEYLGVAPRGSIVESVFSHVQSVLKSDFHRFQLIKPVVRAVLPRVALADLSHFA